ncbi:MAG: hypothetical protein ACFFCE_03250 [Promethearchaeota archaeon]
MSYYTFAAILVILDSYGVVIGLNLTNISIIINLYLLTTISVLIFSITLNIKKNNTQEKFSLYLLISILSFISLMNFTNILAIYNVTISIFLFLFFTGIYFHHQKDERYKWFIKPCVILFVFDFISFLSYSWFFNNQIYGTYNPILTFTLTLSISDFGLILLYNDAPKRLRNKFFFAILASIVIAFPTFLYFIIIASLSMHVLSIVPLIFAIDFGVFLFYFCIGIYHWRISWTIWKSGWYVWNILPFINFFIIYQSFTGIDVLTDSLQFGVFQVKGSFIISIIICSLFFLPVLYTKIKKYFFQIIFIIWGESLFLLYWISLNLFISNLLLRNLSFLLFAVILLMPLFVGVKYWKIVSKIWLMLTAVNGFFLFFYLISISVDLEIAISIDVLVIGFLLIVYSFFPNIRSRELILLCAYIVSLLGIFFTVVSILYLLILDLIFSINISFIVVGLSLFSSKYIKISNKYVSKIIDFSLSWILIFNLAWLIFNMINLITGFFVLASSLWLTVIGFSFFIFNRYRMGLPINNIIQYLIIIIGASLSATSFVSLIFKASPGILISTFSSVSILFFYFLIKEYRYFLWFCFPIPINSPILEAMLSLDVIQPYWLLTWSMLYLIVFQIIINIFKKSVQQETQEIKQESQEIENSIFRIYKNKIQLRWFNFICFLLNSICISLFIGIILPNLMKQLLFTQILIIYQLCDFLIIWSVLFLFCMKYIEKSDLNVNFKEYTLFFNKISYILYLLIPLASGFNLLLYLFFINWEIRFIIFSFLILFSGILFIEGFILDNYYFKFMFKSTRNWFNLWSWLIFCNTLAVLLFLLYLNLFLLMLTISLLNLISVKLSSHLDKYHSIRSSTRLILIYNSFIWSSFYLSSLISGGLLLLFEEIRGFLEYSLLIQNAFLFLYFLSYFLIKFEKTLKNRVEFILFIVFQGLSGINLAYIFHILNYLNFLIVNIIIFLQICLTFNTIKIYNKILPEQKYPNFLEKMHSNLFLALYLEISLITYGLSIKYLGLFESILSSLLILFILTILDIYSIKKIIKFYARFVHSISFIVISIMLLIILNQYISLYSILLSLEFLIFLIMQFYSNFSLFKSLEMLSPQKIDTFRRYKSSIQHILGAFFYFLLSIIILQLLIIQRINFQIILLVISCIIHVLMIIDKKLLKFLGRSVTYFELLSWGLIMAFSLFYLIWFYNTFFIEIFYTVIPLVIIVFIIEFTYLLRLISSWHAIVLHKEQIKLNLIIVSYINFITWPLYFISFNFNMNLNLILIAVLILLLITLFDSFLEEKLRKILKSSAFLTSGALLSVDLYLLLEYFSGYNHLLNINITFLIFMIFLIIIVKPFKKHSILALTFWLVIFFLLSSIIYQLSLSSIFSIIIFVIMLLIYPFIFLLEQLKEIFSWIVDTISKIFRLLKTIIKNVLLKISYFIKIHYRAIWTIINIIASIFFGILFSDVIFGLLNPIHATLLIFPIFGLLYSFMPSKKSDDPDIKFRRRMIRLIISWSSVIIVLFAFITPIWYIFTIWISIWIVGAILLPYMIFKEKKENISIKWRFYTLIFLIILLIFFGIIFVIQISGAFIF